MRESPHDRTRGNGEFEGRSGSAKRRSILKLAALGGGVGVLATGTAAGKSSGTPGAASKDDATRLGDFEEGLDGWKTNGGNALSRVTSEEIPAGVSSGQYALAVEVNGDLFPMIENKKAVKAADFSSNPYLQVHVLAAAERTDSDLLFRFRLHHKGRGTGGKKNGKNAGGSPGSKGVNVEESDLIRVPQVDPRRVQWDMSELPETVLRNAKRLEIVWYLEDHEPTGGHRGKSKGEFDYRGLVVFDDVRLSDSVPVPAVRQQQRKKMDLHRNHGMVVDRSIDEQTQNLERGTLTFADGSSVAYTFEILGEGSFSYTIDGETFEFGRV